MLRALQRDIIFPRHYAPPDPTCFVRVPDLERLWLDLDGGERVEAFFLAARNITRPAPAVIFAHGNAELIDYWADAFEPWRQLGVHVLLPEYRGYGRSGGEPGEDVIREDFVAFYDRLVARPEVDASRIILHGRSLGGGAVCGLASQRPAAALILQSTFTSITALARAMMVPGFVMVDKFDSLSVVQRFEGPVLVAHGTADEFIPFAHAEALAKAARQGQLITWSCGHNDSPPPNQAAWWRDLRRFVEEAGLLDE